MFTRNPYTVNNLGDLWELNLADTNSVLHNDGHRHLPNAIDPFPKYVQTATIHSRTGEDVFSAFRSILGRSTDRRPQAVQTDKGKEFVKASCSRVRS